MAENKLHNIAYSYVTQISDLEEENKFLKESLENLEKELEKFKKTPLIACEVKDIIDDNILVRLPNGNELDHLSYHHHCLSRYSDHMRCCRRYRW